jgi:hypothetical protein
VAENYEEYAFGRLRVWGRGANADKFSTVVYGIADLAKDGAFEANLVGLVKHCPTDAVEEHGRARMLEKLSDSFESLQAFRNRCIEAWDFWAGVTTTEGLEDCLILHGENQYNRLEVVDISNDGWLNGYVNGSWGEDDNADNWARVNVIIPQPHPWTIPVVGTGSICGPDTMCGLTMTSNELSNIRRTFRKHRPAHIAGIGIDVLLDSTTASDYLNDHGVTTDIVRLPLLGLACGYGAHGAQCGVAICGQVFT